MTEDQLRRAYRAAVSLVRSRLVDAVTRLWRHHSRTGYGDPAAVEFAAAVVPLVTGGQAQVAQLTAAYLAGLPAADTDTGQDGGVDAEAFTGSAVRRVDPDRQYQRPFTEARRALATGADTHQTIQRGTRRAAVLVETDLQLAKTHTADAVLRRRGARWYRRVLTGDTNCGLCVVASTQRYRVGDLLPIHPGCDCAVAPLPDDAAAHQVIDPDLLEAAHTAIEERFGPGAVDFGARDLDYRKVLLVRQHGELGPLLTVAGHRFTSEDDLEDDNDDQQENDTKRRRRRRRRTTT